MRYLLILLLPFLILFSFSSKAQQNKIEVLMVKLNKLHKENRIIQQGKIQEIFLNKTAKVIDIDGYELPLTNYTAHYENIYNPHYKKNLDVVYLKCLDGNCIQNLRLSQELSAMGLYFKSKKACYDFINELDEIRSQLDLS